MDNCASGLAGCAVISSYILVMQLVISNLVILLESTSQKVVRARGSKFFDGKLMFV